MNITTRETYNFLLGMQNMLSPEVILAVSIGGSALLTLLCNAACCCRYHYRFQRLEERVQELEIRPPPEPTAAAAPENIAMAVPVPLPQTQPPFANRYVIPTNGMFYPRNSIAV